MIYPKEGLQDDMCASPSSQNPPGVFILAFPPCCVAGPLEQGSRWCPGRFNTLLLDMPLSDWALGSEGLGLQKWQVQT